MACRPWQIGDSTAKDIFLLWLIDLRDLFQPYTYAVIFWVRGEIHLIMVKTSLLLIPPAAIFAAMRILMVCLGNICRSPLAEGILRHKAEQAGLSLEVDSAGTGHWHAGEAPDPRSVSVAQKHGLNISGQRARTLSPYDLETFDHIFAMDASNYRDILNLAVTNEEKGKVRMIMNLSQPGKNVGVPDPYYGTDGFEHVFNMLSEACDALIEELS